jgi:F-type H+-transporting ATPase subunit c
MMNIIRRLLKQGFTFNRKKKEKIHMRKFNKFTLWVLALNVLALPAFAEEAAASTSSGNGMAAALAIAIAAFGGAIGQGLTASAAVNGVSRNPGAQPKLFPLMIIGLALIESLVILSFVIANGLAK